MDEFMSTEVKNLSESYLASNENDEFLDIHTRTHIHTDTHRDAQTHTYTQTHTQTHSSSSANVDQSLFISSCFLYDL